jgi:hypothetical protein
MQSTTAAKNPPRAREGDRDAKRAWSRGLASSTRHPEDSPLHRHSTVPPPGAGENLLSLDTVNSVNSVTLSGLE